MPGANIFKVRPVLMSINITVRRLVLPSVNIYKVRPVLLNFYITERRIGYGGIVSVRFVECIFCFLFPASVSTSAPLPPLLASRASHAPLPRRLTGAGGAGLLLLAAGPRALSPALPPGSTLEPAHSREECRKPGSGPRGAGIRKPSTLAEASRWRRGLVEVSRCRSAPLAAVPPTAGRACALGGLFRVLSLLPVCTVSATSASRPTNGRTSRR